MLIMGKLCITIKSRYGLPLVFSIGLIAALYSCNRIKEPHAVLSHKVAATQTLGTVSVSIYGTLGLKDEQSIARQLGFEAQKLYPGSSAIANIRYDKSIAYADVVK